MDVTFRRYRAISFITGTTLLTLFATLLLNKVDLSLWTHIKLFVQIDGIAHGFLLYPLYMIMCFNLVMKFQLNVANLALMLFAGFVPGLAFYLEYRMRVKLYPLGLPSK